MRSYLPAPLLLSAILLFSLGIQGASAVPLTATADTPHQHRVVFQVSDSDEGKWALTLNNVDNMQADLGKKNIQIEVVVYGPGIGMLKMDSKFGSRIREAIEKGVRFAACQNTMRSQHLTREDMLADINYVPSGVIEVMKKQEEGYTYIRP